MPWFCGSSKKRHSKAKVGNIPQSNDSPTVTNGRPSFTVVLQDFEATVADELSAHRGQVLEALYTNKEWVYVRNIDGKCGYVPQSFCYSLETISDNAFIKKDNPPLNHPRPMSLHLDMAPVAEDSQNSLGVSLTEEQVDGQVSATPVTRHISLPTPESALSQPSPLTPQRPPRPSHRRSLSSGNNHRNITLNATDSTVSQPSSSNPQRPTHRRSLSNGSYRNLSITVADLSAKLTEPINPVIKSAQVTMSAQVNPSAKVNSSTSPGPQATEQITSSTSSHSPKILQRRQSCPTVGDTPVQSSSFKYTPYSARPQAMKRSMSMNEHCSSRARPQVPTVHRSLSYRGAIRPANDKTSAGGPSSDDGQDTDTATPVSTRRLSRLASNGMSPSAPAERHSSSESPTCTRKNCDCSKRPPGSNPRRNKLSRQLAVDYDSSSDEVFLPTSEQKKPFGIFRCIDDHESSFKGEISLHKNELVIILDYGRGQWAWVMTSHHAEGLAPKRLLVRYDSARGTGGAKTIDVTTQTELVVSDHIRQVAASANNEAGTYRQDSMASSASLSASSARQLSSVSSASGGPSANTSPVNTMTQTEVASSATQKGAWFSFEDSLERSIKASTPKGKRRLPKSAPVTPVSPTSKQPQRLNSNTDRSKSFSTRALGQLTQQGTGVLTAVKDYEPPDNTNNCLTLKKGDVLTPQLHMHYPKGWMWVWHPGQKRFGYVPKSSVVYTYPITRRNRRTATVEAAV